MARLGASAPSVAEALGAARRRDRDVMLMDVRMSEPDGSWATARLVAELRLHGRVQTVVLAHEPGVVRAGER